MLSEGCVTKQCSAATEKLPHALSDLKEVAAAVPLERILLETDCPYLAPTPHRGRRNSSLYLPLVVEEIARIRGIAPQEVEDTC